MRNKMKFKFLEMLDFFEGPELFTLESNGEIFLSYFCKVLDSKTEQFLITNINEKGVEEIKGGAVIRNYFLKSGAQFFLMNLNGNLNSFEAEAQGWIEPPEELLPPESYRLSTDDSFGNLNL